MEHRHEMVIMLVYSAMKNMANLKLAYSVWNPATSSDSASGKSKGTRLVSATAAVKKQKKPRSCGQTFQLNRPKSRCPAGAAGGRVDSLKLSLLGHSRTPTAENV